MQISLEEVNQVFEAQGFQHTHATQKVGEYTSRTTRSIVYLRKEVGLPHAINLVIAPSHPTGALETISGVIRAADFLHSSNMRKFPKRMNNGEKSIPYGSQFRVASLTALSALLSAMS